MSQVKTQDPNLWTKSRVQALVAGNDTAAVRALLVVYSRQTSAEQSQHATTDLNGIGFTGADAEILSSFASFFSKRGFLSPNQLAILKKKIGKYWKQLLAEIESKGLPVSYSVTK